LRDSIVSARRKEKAPWTAPAGLKRGLKGANRMFATGRRIPHLSIKIYIFIRAYFAN
jgi:hypothetical protein